MSKVLVVINANSRKGAAEGASAIEELKKLGLTVVEGSGVIEPEALQKTLQNLPAGLDLVVVGGGDGSIASALEPLVGSKVALGVLPFGTANSFARNIGLPLTLPEAIQVIGRMKTALVDLGKVNDTLFLNVAGLGLSVRIHHVVPAPMKKKFGIFAYAFTGLKLLRETRPMKAEITCDGKTYHVKSWQISVCNGRYYGGWMQVSKDATMDDRLLHVCSTEVKSIWQAVKLLPSFLKGTYDSRSGIRIIAGRDISIRTSKPAPLDADGEIIGHSPAHFELFPDALKVIVP